MTSQGPALSLASINIERSRHLPRVAAFLRAHSPDVACLQELVEEDLPGLCEDLKFAHHIYAPMCRMPESGASRLTGIAILSRHAFESTQDIVYAGGGSGAEVVDRISEDRRSQTIRYLVALAAVRLGGVLYTIATTHFPWTDNARTTPFQRTACGALLRSLGSRSLVLAGDFNAPRGGEISVASPRSGPTTFRSAIPAASIPSCIVPAICT